MAIQTKEVGDKLQGRDSANVQAGGGGSSIFLAGTGKFQFLVNYKCKFAAKYLQNKNFTVIKCDIPDKILQKVINYKKQ